MAGEPKEKNDAAVEGYIAASMSKGKKNDHVMHNAGLDDLIKHYISSTKDAPTRQRLLIDRVFADASTRTEGRLHMDFAENLRLWQDRAPTQYRSRQSFIQVASIQERRPDIELYHRSI